MPNRIRELRQAKRMTQLRLSMELEVTQETVSAYETGKHDISLKSLMRMADIFDVSIDYLLKRTDERNCIHSSDLTEQELELICGFRRLNKLLKEKMLSYLDGLLHK